MNLILRKSCNQLYTSVNIKEFTYKTRKNKQNLKNNEKLLNITLKNLKVNFILGKYNFTTFKQNTCHYPNVRSINTEERKTQTELLEKSFQRFDK